MAQKKRTRVESKSNEENWSPDYFRGTFGSHLLMSPVLRPRLWTPGISLTAYFYWFENSVIEEFNFSFAIRQYLNMFFSAPHSEAHIDTLGLYELWHGFLGSLTFALALALLSWERFVRWLIRNRRNNRRRGTLAWAGKEI